ncbi:MAG: hypothetical protein KTR18_01425 [Acidiferrobacterales bacterium]|nr:hypothetical protein [Acidiferrobacterales bacterium]
MSTPAPRLYSLCFLIWYLTACSDGDGGGGVTGISDTSQLAQNINGELTGQLLHDDHVIDLSTGVGVFISGFEATSANPDGSELYSLVDDCDAHTSAPGNFSCIYIRSREGLIKEQFTIPYTNLNDSFYVSPDGDLFAITTRDISLADEQVVIYTRSGDFVTSLVDPDGFDWLNDGRFIYSKNQQIFLSSDSLDDEAQDTVVATFSEAEGLPAFFAVSPDGSELVFALRDRTIDGVLEHSGLWRLNLNTLESTRFAGLETSANQVGSSLRWPLWSPDGQWLVTTVYQSLTESSLVALRTAVSDHVVIQQALTSTENQKVIQTLCNQICQNEIGPNQLERALAWTTNTLPTRSKGSLPASGAGLHAGITGSMVYLDHNLSGVEFKTYDLATGTKQDLARFPEGTPTRTQFDPWSINGSATEIVYFQVDRPFYRLTNSEITASLIPDLSNRANQIRNPKLSPQDNALLAYSFQQTREPPDASMDVNVVNIESGEFLQQYEARALDWLPNGDLFLHKHREQKLQQVDAVTGTVRAETDRAERVYGLTVSPDGQRVAMIMMGHVWVSSLDGSNLRQLTQSVGNEAWAEWSPDGRYIVVQHNSRLLVNEPSTEDFYIVAADATRAWIGAPAAMGIQSIEVQFSSGNFPYGPLRWR